MTITFFARCFGLLSLCSCSIVMAEPLKTEPYTKVFSCPTATIHVAGMRCENEDECPYISNSASENVSLQTKSGKRIAIEALDTSFPSSKRILRDEGNASHPRSRLYVVLRVDCLPKNQIGILYWGGGNCSSGCENYVTYFLGPEGQLLRKVLHE